jgi:hypothetical protein
MTCDASMSSWKSGGYELPGVEAKLSARLSAGDSNLICGVVAILNVSWWCVVICEYYNGFVICPMEVCREWPSVEVCQRQSHHEDTVAVGDDDRVLVTQ